MTVEKLLQELDIQIKYLAADIKIPGMDSSDTAQELRLVILQDYRKLEKKGDDMSKYRAGWWFKRLKWHALNLLEKAKREPVNGSVRIEKFKDIR